LIFDDNIIFRCDWCNAYVIRLLTRLINTNILRR